MKKLIYIISFLFSIYSFADTTFVTVHNNVDMTWHGSYNAWGEFPDGQENYRKILMHYTLGCASSGCSGWDYTTNVNLKKRFQDSTNICPNFIINGDGVFNNSIQNSISFSYNPTYNISYLPNTDTLIYNNTLTGLVDTIIWGSNDTIWNNNSEIIFLDNNWDHLDTNYVYQNTNSTFSYDSLGNIIDTIYFTIDSTINLTFSNSNTYYKWNVIEEFELGRVITPYGTYMQAGNSQGSGFFPDWNHKYTFDVTDYAMLLKDSVELEVFYDGWSSGFSAKIEFEFIEGIPPHEIIEIQNIYYGTSSSGYYSTDSFTEYKNGTRGYSYSNSQDFESNKMPGVYKQTNPNSDWFYGKITVTGHGQSGEFTPNIFYYLKSNNITQGNKEIWKDDCGMNSLAPQGGTWIYDRANWCPGEQVRIYDHKIDNINPGDSTEINIDLTSYSPSSGATYIFSAHFFECENPNFNLDAEIIDIMAPSKKDNYSKINPICGKPIIEIRNSGIINLTSLEINYGVKGGSVYTKNWTGNLAYLEKEIITLDNFNWNGTHNIFEVNISNPNGANDENLDNNFLSSDFETTPMHQNEFNVIFNTNNYSFQNSWVIVDNEDNLIYGNPPLSNNNNYTTSVNLSPGCYTFRVFDTGDDGLEWWANSAQGSGNVQFSQIFPPPPFIVLFNSDFGSEIIHNFTVGYALNIDNKNDKIINIYPNPTKNQATIETNNKTINKISIYNSFGQSIKTFFPNNNKIELKTIDMSPGYYIIKITSDNTEYYKKLIITN
tara:strand:- start:3172 stop:5487 length:2316 start_codon:yes stop_codon:yes gene_type:complete